MKFTILTIFKCTVQYFQFSNQYSERFCLLKLKLYNSLVLSTPNSKKPPFYLLFLGVDYSRSLI